MTRDYYINVRKANKYSLEFIFLVWNDYSGKPQTDINLFITALQLRLLAKRRTIDELLEYIVSVLDEEFQLVFVKDKDENILNIF